jgi:riboflavin synthase
MFTGIVEALGRIAEVLPKGGDLSLRIETGSLDLTDVQLGDSIAVNGVCLTAVALTNDSFSADVSCETLVHTEFEQLQAGMLVNLEKALTLSRRLGGHLVSGHVDGIGTVLSRQEQGRSVRFSIRAPEQLAKYIAHKGSITVDGVSLTVNAVDGTVFELNIVPHTVEETVIKYYSVGRRVNLEVDLIARYLERLLLGDKAAQRESESGEQEVITAEFLAEHGFSGRI